MQSSPVSRRTGSEMGNLGILLGIYLLMCTAPIAELLDTYLHINFSEVLITWVLVTAGVLFSGRADRFLQVPLARWWVAIGVLLFLASVFSIYRRQSVTLILSYLLRFHTMPFLICAVALTLSNVRTLIFWPGMASLTLTAVCILLGQYSDGRLNIPGTTLGNPNDLGFLLLFSSTYALIFISSRSTFVRGLWLVSLPITLNFVLRTGSRANFVTVLAALAVVVAIVPAKAKIGLIATALVVTIVLAFVVPASTWERLTTISLDADRELRENPDRSSELGSQIARVELQKRAYQLALENPLFGVGPLMFPQAADQMVRRDTGVKTAWQNPHNVYLQIAAENGIPCAALYILSFVMCWQMNYRCYKVSSRVPRLAAARSQSFCLALATVIYAFGIIFCNFAYEAFWSVLVGLSSANYLAMLAEIKSTSGPVVAGPTAGFMTSPS